MNPDDHVVLVCARVADADPVAGSLTARCKCRALVWVAPSSLAVLHRAVVLCHQCATLAATEAHRRGEPMRFGGFIPGQLEELANEQKKP